MEKFWKSIGVAQWMHCGGWSVHICSHLPWITLNYHLIFFRFCCFLLLLLLLLLLLVVEVVRMVRGSRITAAARMIIFSGCWCAVNQSPSGDDKGWSSASPGLGGKWAWLQNRSRWNIGIPWESLLQQSLRSFKHLKGCRHQGWVIHIRIPIAPSLQPKI